MTSPPRNVSKEAPANISSHTPHTGVESLMNSLISPGPPTPGTGFAPTQWSHLGDWSSAFQSGFGGTSLAALRDVNGASFHQNGDEYTPHEASLSQAGPFVPNVIQNTSSTTSADDPASKKPNSNLGSLKAQMASNTEAAAENAKRLKDLRAQLLARKTKESQPPSPATTSKPTTAKRLSSTNASPKSTLATLPTPPSLDGATPKSKGKQEKATALNQQVSQGAKDETIAGLDKLLAEARKEAAKTNGTNKKAQLVDAEKRKKSDPSRPSSSGRRAASPELSEGEIRSDEDAGPASEPMKPPKLVPEISKDASSDSDEKSRRESEVEVMYKKSIAASRESQEKLRRASQVDLAYSPLRKSGSAASGKSAKLPLDTSAVNRKLLGTNQNPKSAVEASSHSWVAPQKARAAEYDSYVPSYPRTSNLESSGFQQTINGKRAAGGDRVEHRDRQRAIDQNERAALEYKRALANRPQPERVISHTNTTYLGRMDDDDNQKSPKSREDAEDPDLKDWLELTEYHDETFRQSRLARFRKKRELERLRLQLEEEEQLELQTRSQLRGPRVGSELITQASIMGPPGLAIRGTGVKPGSDGNPVAAVAASSSSLIHSAENGVTTPTLKRHHAEDFTDPRTKIPRVETSTHNNRPAGVGGASAIVKDETSPIFSSIPFGDRISRGGGGGGDDALSSSRHQRRRTRSPERTRRRSISPDSGNRRNSVPNYADKRTCHNCGELGHYQTTCPLPRRDGKDRDRFRQLPPQQQQQSKQRYDAGAGSSRKPSSGFKQGGPRGYHIDDDDRRP